MRARYLRDINAYLSTCSHNDFSDFLFISVDPTSKVSLLCIWDPNPFLLVKFGLLCSGPGRLSTQRKTWCRHSSSGNDRLRTHKKAVRRVTTAILAAEEGRELVASTKLAQDKNEI